MRIKLHPEDPEKPWADDEYTKHENALSRSEDVAEKTVFNLAPKELKDIILNFPQYLIYAFMGCYYQMTIEQSLTLSEKRMLKQSMLDWLGLFDPSSPYFQISKDRDSAEGMMFNIFEHLIDIYPVKEEVQNLSKRNRNRTTHTGLSY